MSSTRFFRRKPASTWRVGVLRQAVEHFSGVHPRNKATKEDLMEALGLIAEEQNLTSQDGYDTWYAIVNGGELSLKRRVLVSENSRTIHRLLTHLGSYRNFLRTYAEVPVASRHSVVTITRARPSLSANLQALEAQNAVMSNPAENPLVEAGTAMTDREEELDAENEVIFVSEVKRNDPPPTSRPAPQAAAKAASLGLACVVCLEDIGPANRPHRKVSRACDHEPDVCIPCLRRSIAAQFESKVWDQIDCPSCNARLAYDDIKSFADSSVFGRYDNHSLETCLDRGQFRRCRHEGCRSGQHCFPDEDSYMICRECHGRTCISCDIVWHPNESCTEVAARRAAEASRNAEEEATQSYVVARAKRCPQCKALGEKVSDCDRITCLPIMAQFAFGEIQIIAILATTIPTTFREPQAMMHG